jgi:ferredoxin
LAPDKPALPTLDLDKCDGCGRCMRVCPAQALGLGQDQVHILHSDCDYCGECEAVCPTGAISCPFEIVWQ